MEEITYELVRKKVKNITIRVKKDGTVIVTVPLRADIKRAEAFVEMRADWIRQKVQEAGKRTIIHLDELEWTDRKEQYLREVVADVYPLFAAYQIPYPKLKFRKMVSQYGNCHTRTGVITLNKALTQIPLECVEYVAVHELAHLIEANHGKNFYRIIGQVMPDYRIREERLQQYALCH